MNLFSFSAAAVYSLTWSSICLVSAISTGSPMKSESEIAVDISIDDLRGNRNESLGYTSCSSLKACRDCTSTYTCHWCERSKSCHARGSVYGCTWGDSCGADVKPQNNTCASQRTCFDCNKVSRFCHWCEHDNACHAVGSRFGCAIGVNCYSNDQCRRSKPEIIPFPSSPIQVLFATLNRVPMMGFILIAFLGIILYGCTTCCFHFVSDMKDTHSDLVSNIDTIRSTRLDEMIDGFAPSSEGNYTDGDCDITDDNRNNRNPGENTDLCIDGARNEQLSQNVQQCNKQLPSSPVAQIGNQQQEQQRIEESGNPNFFRDGTTYNSTNQDQLQSPELEIGPLLHPSFNSTAEGIEERRYSTLFCKFCSTMYYLSIFAIGITVGASLFFYPQIPECNVCNDEVAWTKIMKNIIEFKFDASFEILASLGNSNHISIALERGQGSFSYDGKQFGTFEIPPVTIASMAITDFMIIIHISPADKTQAIHLAKAYHDGNLIVDVNFEGKVRIPVLFGYSKEVNVKNIEVDVSAASERRLCQCQKWEENEIDSNIVLLESIERQLSFL